MQISISTKDNGNLGQVIQGWVWVIKLGYTAALAFFTIMYDH